MEVNRENPTYCFVAPDPHLCALAARAGAGRARDAEHGRGGGLTMARKDIHLSISLDARTAEQLDQIRALQGISHAEAVRRAIHLLHSSCLNRTITANQGHRRVDARCEIS